MSDNQATTTAGRPDPFNTFHGGKRQQQIEARLVRLGILPASDDPVEQLRLALQRHPLVFGLGVLLIVVAAGWWLGSGEAPPASSTAERAATTVLPATAATNPSSRATLPEPFHRETEKNQSAAPVARSVSPTPTVPRNSAWGGSSVRMHSGGFSTPTGASRTPKPHQQSSLLPRYRIPAPPAAIPKQQGTSRPENQNHHEKHSLR